MAIIGFGLLAKVLLETGIVGIGGTGGTDANDYWIAAGHALAGEPLYAERYGTFLAYSYPPLFAQLLAPFALLPHGVFVWLWRALELASLRLAVGSWTRAGIVLLVFPPAIAEIETGNVHLVMAAACALAMRGTGSVVAPAALLKFASIPLVPLAWVRDRRGFSVGLAVASLAVLASVVIDRGDWTAYVQFLGANSLPVVPAVALTIIPLPVRLAMAAVLGFVAIRWVRVAPLAVLLAYPVVWATSLSTLVAIVTRIPPKVPQRITREIPREEIVPRKWQEVPS